MAKCPVCNTRKAKRKCLITDQGEICSLCCAETRQAETCSECSYYQPPQVTRKYSEVPRYTPARMEMDLDLTDHSNAIEGALGAFDHEKHKEIKDEVAIAILEKLLDKYYFKDAEIIFADALVKEGFAQVDHAIQKDLADVDPDVLIRVLGVIHFVAKRRTRGRREYLKVVEQYVGMRAGPGMRLLQQPKKLFGRLF